MGMRHILLMIAVVMLVGLCLPAAGAGRPENEERPAIVEKTIRMQLKKPKGKLTKADLEKVVSLNLNFTKITDEGLKELPKLKQLTAIDLGSTQITDAGLKELAKLKQLTSLNLNNTKVTKAGVAELQKALSKCKITHNTKK